MDNNTNWTERGKKVIMNTYGRYPFAFVKGEGMYLWDADGKKYLDFLSGIAVNSLGHSDAQWADIISKQLHTLQHTSNLYWIPPQVELAELLVQYSGFHKVFFCNSGAEAMEGAIKLAKKYSFKKYGPQRNGIISMLNSFHGRTMATVTMTGQTKYHKGFNPLYPDITHVPYNDFDALQKAVNANTCAIVLEVIQGEGGIRPATKEFIHSIRKLCDEKDILMVVDEVQTGVGRTGKLFAHQLYDVQPDIMGLAKGLAGGIPIGATLAIDKVAEAFQPGDHASTFGGNYIATVAGKYVIERLMKGGLLKQVEEVGGYLRGKLEGLKAKHSNIVEIRGAGLIQGIELAGPAKDIIAKGIENGLLLIGAGEKVVRFIPALIAEKKHVDEMIAILEKIL